jgi:hypothetical protein
LFSFHKIYCINYRVIIWASAVSQNRVYSLGHGAGAGVEGEVGAAGGVIIWASAVSPNRLYSRGHGAGAGVEHRIGAGGGVIIWVSAISQNRV